MSNTNDMKQPEPAAWPGPLDRLVGRPACDRRSFVLAVCSGLVAAVSYGVRKLWGGVSDASECRSVVALGGECREGQYVLRSRLVINPAADYIGPPRGG